jgi:hypothetical protein
MREKDSCWFVGMFYDPRGLPGVSTVGRECMWCYREEGRNSKECLTKVSKMAICRIELGLR